MGLTDDAGDDDEIKLVSKVRLAAVVFFASRTCLGFHDSTDLHSRHHLAGEEGVHSRPQISHIVSPHQNNARRRCVLRSRLCLG
jgi:hypothetical protein